MKVNLGHSDSLCHTAIEAAYGFMIYCRGLARKEEVEKYKRDLREGIDLLAMLERVHQASREVEKITDSAVYGEYELVRNHLFVSRVSVGQIGYEAYESVIREAVEKELDRLLADMESVQALTRKAISDPTSLSEDEQTKCQDFFTALASRMHPE
ncbi:MAG: hypothetical protein ABIH38_05680 [Patescibacteria group bacterium]